VFSRKKKKKGKLKGGVSFSFLNAKKGKGARAAPPGPVGEKEKR